MAIGARDHIDQLLVRKYAAEKVDNHDNTPSLVEADKMLAAMNDYAQVHRDMLALKMKLTSACSGIVAKNAQYRSNPHRMGA